MFPKKRFSTFRCYYYGGSGADRWVNLVSVLDGNTRLRELWIDMNDRSQWESGWRQLSREEANPSQISRTDNLSTEELNECMCLHPSSDSGLLIPLDESPTRPWFPG